MAAICGGDGELTVGSCRNWILGARFLFIERNFMNTERRIITRMEAGGISMPHYNVNSFN